MTFDEWWKGAREIPQTKAAAKEAWNAAIKAALNELETHWYSKDKAQRAVQDLLTQD